MSLISFSRDKFIPSDEVSLNVRGNYLSVTRGYQVFTFFKTTNNGIPVFWKITLIAFWEMLKL